MVKQVKECLRLSRGPLEDWVVDGKTGIQRTVQEVQAGPTYSSNIEDQDVEVTTIPPPIPKPGPAGLDTTGKEFVFFDLETRGFDSCSAFNWSEDFLASVRNNWSDSC
ncbi:hypothetical protein DPMN_158983 [Dreissena polymorpha]|uniref:Uncharacterized protein n=1 Tax=Dreissena polymorpha TaxID=45954 RepID=A0A9D4IRD3_DREPO|nr:hypothetical protein DPMN_158983 [Dreissena polymorpha]